MPGVPLSAGAGPSTLKRTSSAPPVEERPSKKSKVEASGERREKRRRNKKKKKVPVVQPVVEERQKEQNQPVASGSGSPSSSSSVKPDTVAATPVDATPPTLHDTVDTCPKSSAEIQVRPESSSVAIVNGPAAPVVALSLATAEHNSLEVGKAKEEAAGKEELNADVMRLNEELAAKDKLLSQYTSFFGSMQERLTCEICLDLLYKPYSLSPCGHIACEDCLVKWFSSEVVEPEPDAPRMIRIKKCPSCREEIIERPSMVWKIKDAVEIFVKSGLAENLPPPPEEPQTRGRDPWREIFPPVIRRNNRLPPPFPVLPHIGEMLPNGHRMPVIPIPFPQAQAMLDAQMMGNLDAEDGGIYRCVECHYEIVDGVCAGCGQLYDDNPNLDYEGEGYDDVGDYSDVEEGEPRQEDDHEHAWLHNGYSWPLDAGDAGEERAGDGLWPAEEPPRRYRRRIVGEGEDADDGEDFDDEYESSFIDDGDEAGYRSPSRDLYSRSPSRDLYSRSPSRDLYSHSPTRVAPPRRRSNVQVPWPSSRERSGAPAPEDRLLWSWTSGSGSSQSQTAASSAEEPVAGPSSSSPSPARVRRRTALVIESDDDEEEEEEDHEESLAEQVAAREREIYGDDGSVAHRFEDVIGNIDDGEEYALEADDDEGEYNPEEDDEEGYSDREELDWGAVDATVDFSDEEAAGFSYGDEDYDVPGEYYDY